MLLWEGTPEHTKNPRKNINPELGEKNNVFLKMSPRPHLLGGASSDFLTTAFLSLKAVVESWCILVT